jgi:hypothetical protein
LVEEARRENRVHLEILDHWESRVHLEILDHWESLDR